MKSLLSFFLLVLTVYAYDAPYRLEKFQGVLKKTKLQAPLSSYNPQWCVKYGEFRYFSNKYFYLQDNNYMDFEVCGLKHRSELREKKNWQVSTEKLKTLEAKLFLFVLNSKREFTFLQIHSDPNYTLKGQTKTGLNKPLLRITWWKSHHKIKDHLWAVIRMSANSDEQKYIKVDLGKKDNDFCKIKITVQNSKLKIFVNEKIKVNMDVSYWNNEWNYFKAGVYMQDDGCAKVLFKELEIKDEI